MEVCIYPYVSANKQIEFSGKSRSNCDFFQKVKFNCMANVVNKQPT